MSGSLPLGSPLSGAGFPAAGRVAHSGVVQRSGPIPEPKVDRAAQHVPAALQGAVRSAGPRMALLGRMDWTNGLAAPAGLGSDATRMLRQAAHGKLPPPPSGERGVVQLAGRRAKADLSFLGLFTIRRDTRYKAVLASAETLKQLYDQKPASDREGRRAQLAEIRNTLTSFQEATEQYARRASLVRRPVMQALSIRSQLEQAMIDSIERSLEAKGGEVADPVRSATLGNLLNFTRAGVDLDTAGEALDLGIDPKLIGEAAQTTRAAGRLPLPTLALLARYPESHEPGAIDDLVTLTRKGFSIDELDQALALGLSVELVTMLSRSERATLPDRRAYLQAMIDVDYPGQAAHEIDDDERAWLNGTAREFYDHKIPLELVSPCRRAGYDAKEAFTLVKAGIGADQIALAAKAGLSGSDLRHAVRRNLPIEDFGWIRRSEPSRSRADQAVRNLPDDATLGWLRAEPTSGRKLLRAEAAALLGAGAEDKGLPLDDLVRLMDAGVSVDAVARLTRSPPAPGAVQSVISLDTGDTAPFSRTEALLLAGAGWPASADTVSAFRATYPNGRAIIPVTERTVIRDLAQGPQIGDAKALGSGAFNAVFAVNFLNQTRNGTREAVFKPFQTATSKRIPAAAEAIGINLNAPRYELRNLAHSQIDQLLGFGVVPRCEIAVVEGVPGLLMERVDGATARRGRKWDPPVDISQTPLGRQCLQFRNSELRHQFAERKGIDIEVVKNRQGQRQVLLYHGDYVAPLEASQGDWQRSLIGLQWLHALTGAADSHDENIMRSRDGRRFVGIDNDMSFGMRTSHPDELIRIDNDRATRAFHGKGLPPIVDREQYTALMSITELSLREAIGDLIRPDEFEATVDRLKAVQKHLRQLWLAGQVIEPHQWGSTSFAVIEQAKGESYAERLLQKWKELPIGPP